MDVYKFTEFDYNKPTPQEITRGKTHAESQNRLRGFEKDPVTRASEVAAQQEMLEKLNISRIIGESDLHLIQILWVIVILKRIHRNLPTITIKHNNNYFFYLFL